MVIWLRNPQAEGTGLGVGVEGDVLRHERLATIVDIDAGYAEMRRQCDEALQAARAGAEAILDDARMRADELVARAEGDFASAARRGYEDGFEQGLSDWHARAVEAHADACTLERKARDRLAGLVALAVEQIVASEDPKALFARAAATIERIVADGSPVQLRVHPSDVAAASTAFQAVASAWRDAGRSVRLHVSADAALAPGACVAETDLGTVDASLSLHLAAMRGALARAVQSVLVADFSVPESADEGGVDQAADVRADNAWINDGGVLEALPDGAGAGSGDDAARAECGDCGDEAGQSAVAGDAGQDPADAVEFDAAST